MNDSDESSSTLDQWEAEAKDEIHKWPQDEASADEYADMTTDTKKDQRILELINLVRKKDAKMIYLSNHLYAHGTPKNSEELEVLAEALALTEELK